MIEDNRKQTTKEIKEMLTTELKSMQTEIVKLQTELEKANQRADNAEKAAEQFKKDIKKIQEKNTSLDTKLTTTKKELIQCIDTVEDNKNRQLRKTLVFRGIDEMTFPDDPNKQRQETWEETAKVLADCMAKKMNISTREAESMVERCHRSKPNPRYNGTAPRPIFAAFCNWKDSELTKKTFRESNISGQMLGNNNRKQVIVENKYGPRTTVRRNMALQERKELKQAGRIVSAYVAFPARLMVKEGRDAKYRLMKDFSNEPVQFNR